MAPDRQALSGAPCVTGVRMGTVPYGALRLHGWRPSPRHFLFPMSWTIMKWRFIVNSRRAPKALLLTARVGSAGSIVDGAGGVDSAGGAGGA